MKQNNLSRQILIPITLVLLLLPALSFLIFRYTAKQNAYIEAAESLGNFQKKMVRNIRTTFSPEANDTENETSYEAKLESLFTKTGRLLRRYNNISLIILDSNMEVIYSEFIEEDPDNIYSADEFIEQLQINDIKLTNHSLTFQAGNGNTYLVDICEPGIKRSQIYCLIAYSPAFQIDNWVTKASIIECIISYIVAFIVLITLCMTIHRITRPLQSLCHEAERIGNGNFESIEHEFSIRELEELRLSMNLMSDRLQRSNDAQKNFFQNVSHELRTPLMSISGYAQGIEQGIFKTPESAAHTILEESIRLTDLVNGLLTLSHLENAPQETALHPILLGNIIEDSLTRMNGPAAQQGISIILSPFDHTLMVSGEEELFDKVLDNLLTNALRYAKKAITISVTKQENYICITIEDDGDGIDEKDLPHLFERFYKGDGGHFGIGLATALSAATKMGGNLKADNRENGGAVFTLSLMRA